MSIKILKSEKFCIVDYEGFFKNKVKDKIGLKFLLIRRMTVDID